MDEGVAPDLSIIIANAYQRGAAWARENPESPEYIVKASLDYADKTQHELEEKLTDGVECPLCGICP